MSRGRKKGAARSLTTELGALLSKTILPDLMRRAAQAEGLQVALQRQHAHERAAHRTGESFDAWRDRWLEQVGVAWILSVVFVRTLEDRGYVSRRRIAGRGAADSEQLFFDLFHDLGARDYLEATFRELAKYPGAREVLGPARNPAFRLGLGGEAARELLKFFREEDAVGSLVWRFEGEATRFLGDLYQDISEGVKARYALLQTPEFVEEFILERTLTPAIAEWGAGEVRVIDPTCGSGHFLLGAFETLFEAHRHAAPGLPEKELANRALSQVYGVDVNPYAAAIARFRLILAYLRKAGIERLEEAPRVEPKVVVADSLLHGATGESLRLSAVSDNAAAWGDELYELEDPQGSGRVFGQKYHVVVGNPPYITCKDKELSQEYRKRYVSAYREFALAAPFTERFFQLAADGGYVGMINANSFMKREFGKKLIEEVLPKLDMFLIVDTSGAYIPGHGTPTVLLFGRNKRPTAAMVQAVLGKRGEPQTPEKPEEGLVWRSVLEHADQAGFDNEFVSVARVPRASLGKHPWSLGGGGAADLKQLLEERGSRVLGQMVDSVGLMCMTRADDVYFVPRHALRNARVQDQYIIENVEGEFVRDWTISQPNTTVFPYDADLDPVTEEAAAHVHHFLWPYRTLLWLRREPNGNHRQIGLTWWEWSRFQKRRFRTGVCVAFAFVATHNHFALSRGGMVFNRTAPVIMLPEGAGEDEHLFLLAYLGSSTACFWMKQVLHDKGSGTDSGKWQAEPAKIAFEFAGTPLLPLPVPDVPRDPRGDLVDLARACDALAHRRASLLRTALPPDLPDNLTLQDIQARLQQAEQEHDVLLQRLIFLQEQIDWTIYAAMRLASADIPRRFRAASPGDPPPIPLGARPFEMLLARAGQPKGIDGQSLLPKPPPSWPSAIVELWEACIQHIDQSRELQLIETPDYKRRWAITPKDMSGQVLTFADLRAEHLRAWLLDRLEARAFRDHLDIQSTRQIRDALLRDHTFQAIAHSYAGPGDLDLETLLRSLTAEEAVPHLTVLRFTDTGLQKRVQWEHTWDLQRREDKGEQVGDIPVPQKYDAKDYRDAIYWRLRGKLDVPKERFISYPGAESDDSQSPLFGWAGWDHLERATALAALYLTRKNEDGWPADRLVPLLAGLLELVPWLKQWYNDPREDFGGERLGDYYERYVENEARALGKTLDDLRIWRPQAKRGGRKKG